MRDTCSCMSGCGIYVILLITNLRYDTVMLCSVAYSYKRSAALSQFVMHRGLIISVMQVS